jgi:nitrate reductase molybdenum cofactor assembly chaperone NarJ/NarW
MTQATDRERRILEDLAALLGYPGPATARRARDCARRLRGTRPRAAELLERFAGRCDATSPGLLEELYTATFDLAPACVPYVGHHLFGEGRERSMFLARLRGMQREEGFVAGSELPDHVCEVLRLVALARDAADRDALIDDGLAPAVEKMLPALAEARHPWADVLGAVAEVVADRAADAAGPPLRREVVP